MAKIKMDSNLLDRAKKAAASAGYSSVEEFINHIIEKETARFETSEENEETLKQLRGLGYIE